MIRLKALLEDVIKEMPMGNLSTIGNFEKGSSFTNPADRKLLTHPVAVQKIVDFFKNTDETFDFYFVNTKHARNFTEVGEVDESFIYDELKVTPDQLKDGKINYDNITVFFTNNKGAERYPMTPWIIAHRFGHVTRRLEAFEYYRNWVDAKFKEILKSYGVEETPYRSWYGGSDGGSNYKQVRAFQLAKRHLAETLGTFKSARDKNLREEFEFQYEWLALYLKTGKTPLNPLPDVMTLGHGAFGRANVFRIKDKEAAESSWNELITDGPYYMNQLLSECRGKIFVM